MAVPAIVWRNPNSIQRRRVWNRVKRNDSRSLYLVVESAPGKQCEWKGMPNLEIVQGGATLAARDIRKNHRLPSGT